MAKNNPHSKTRVEARKRAKRVAEKRASTESLIKEIVNKATGVQRKIIDPELITKLAHTQCTIKEICAVVDIDENALYANYKDALRKGREQGLSDLRRKQWEKAMGGDTTMLIWLGKMYLGQKDKSVVEGTNNQPFTVVVNKLPYKELDGKETIEIESSR